MDLDDSETVETGLAIVESILEVLQQEIGDDPKFVLNILLSAHVSAVKRYGIPVSTLKEVFQETLLLYQSEVV